MQTHGDGSRRKQRFRERLDVLRESALHHHVTRHLPKSSWTRRQWIHASLFTTIGIMVATIVPGFSTAMKPEIKPLATVPLALPDMEPHKLVATPGDNWQSISVRPGQTLSAIFESMGVPAGTLHRILGNKDAAAALRRLHPGDEIAFDLPEGGALRALRYDRDMATRIQLNVTDDSVEEKIIKRDVSVRTAVLSGKVGGSLNRAARKAGLTAANINALTDDIFKYDIDFNSDLSPNDRFSVVVEQTWREGQLVATGPVRAATFTVNGALHSGFRFARPGGQPEYFTAAGKPLKKSFIRMPIPYARLSSRFGARNHPILGKMRMHKGVDYAAATGTPIMAAGDARVQFVGQQNGYGNVVILDHGQGRTTLYGHMSRFSKIHRGDRIAQGTVIGYVGSTGMATGPHLHYEFRVNGVHRNPLQVTLPPPEPLGGPVLAQFKTQTSNALARIRTVESAIYADAAPAPASTRALAEALDASRTRSSKQ
ncbi:peptidoglycan DD-metalloendopeptidase family protein [Pseudoxanthomonas sp.]|uniref:peptidoglycan DD-metalloendopeptidase family protein n=1 Tax=Pseudoxanthomonas sp. TaxID=1871049 RepID=UPI0026335ED2|nr:peptidoglycan DD-metalloendopeptidase family protein [Pseudoxanthomonas sp.]WDS35538.1 MAG: peptidoglycan DD-metalloendopeptidase family protein [Pseudoxanthomonas sp.]